MSDIYVANGRVGEVSPFEQVNPDTCAIKSQQIILNEFGIPCTEDQLVQYSIEHGWYDGNGTAPVDVGNLLEDAGIPCTRQADANVFNLISELSQGHKIIVGVDSAELWHNNTLGEKIHNWFNDFFHGATPDHALIVAGIDTSDPNNIRVMVTDPGSGEHYRSYPLDQFMDAWADSSCYMVSTDIPVPEVSPGMENFNYDMGHIDDVAGMNYADFQVFNDLSSGLPVFAPMDGNVVYPIDSLTHAFFDVANNNVPYADIFGSNYLFNDFLDVDMVTNAMISTYNDGLEQIDFDSLYNLDVVNPSPQIYFDAWFDGDLVPGESNELYSDFLHHCIDSFMAAGDFNSAMYCEQQLMIMDYCEHNGVDFGATFLDI